MEGSKWIAAAASIWIQCSCGMSYTFGIYSPILKSSQGYDQSTLDTISVFKDIGANAGILSGLLYTAVSRRSPPRPWVVHAAGVLQCFIGYFFLWLAVTGAIPRPDVAVMCLFMFLAAHGQTFFNTANVVTALQNFPSYSGTIVGIMKGFLGLSGAVLIQVYQTLYPGKPANFLLMLALLPTLLSLVLMFFVQVHPTPSSNHGKEKTYLNGFSLISIIVAAYIMLLIIVENSFILPPWMRAFTLTILILLLSSPLHVAIKARKHDALHPAGLETPLIKSKLEESGGEDMNLVKAMRTLSFWLLFLAMVCGMGSGMATINNISQIGESLGYTAGERSTLVSLWSIWNFLGRLGAGFVSDILLHKRGWARPLFMIFTLAAMTAGHIIIASGFPGNLYVGSLLVGMCYGSQWSLMPTITSEVFGVKHMGTIFYTIGVACPFGSYFLSVRVIGFIYDKESGVQSSCSGSHCFMLSFFILAGVSLFGSLVALALLLKTRGIYARIARTRMLA